MAIRFTTHCSKWCCQAFEAQSKDMVCAHMSCCTWFASQNVPSLKRSAARHSCWNSPVRACSTWLWAGLLSALHQRRGPPAGSQEVLQDRDHLRSR
jgi:hypothetical protein